MAVRRASSGYRSGELARSAGVSTDTLRYYERKGLLPQPRRLENGYRLYPLEALEQVRLIQAALGIGFSVEELAQILRARSVGAPPCHQVRQLAAQKLEELEERLEEMNRFRKEMRATLRAWDARLAATPKGREARLLESIANRRERSSFASPLFALRFQRKARRRRE